MSVSDVAIDAKPADQAKAEQQNAAEQGKPAEQAKAEQQKPAEQGKPDEQAKAEPQKSADQAKPVEQQKAAEHAKPVTVTAETFDGLTYTLRISQRGSSDEYLVNVAVAGEPPRERAPEKGEKAEEKERRDKDFAESRKRLEERVAREKNLGSWTYVVERKQVAPLLRTREEMIARKPDPNDRKGPPGMPGLPPGFR
jgi:hypothetical protein